MITFLRSTVLTALGGGFMKHTSKSISEAIMPCSAATASKCSHNLLGVINGTSAVISDPEPEGKFCPFDR